MRPERASAGTFALIRLEPARLARTVRFVRLPSRLTEKTTRDPFVKPRPAIFTVPPRWTFPAVQRSWHLTQETRGFVAAEAGAAHATATADAIASVRKGRMRRGMGVGFYGRAAAAAVCGCLVCGF